MGIARVFQSKVLYPEASVKENIVRAIVARSGFNAIKEFFGLEREKHQEIIEQTQQILKLCGLHSAAEEMPKNLPHGFQRLVGLAVALATKPKLLLLDEPVTGMNVEETDIIAHILKNLHQSGLAMIIVEHNVNFVMRISPRIMVLDYGQKIAEGAPEEIRSNPKVIKAFLGV
jgi:branched-chain amino acid transport system ATP-binding protein